MTRLHRFYNVFHQRTRNLAKLNYLCSRFLSYLIIFELFDQIKLFSILWFQYTKQTISYLPVIFLKKISTFYKSVNVVL